MSAPEIRLCLGGNLFGSNPDAEFATRAMGAIDMVVYMSTTEEPQPTTQESMFNYVRLSDGGPVRHEGPGPRSR